MSSRSKKMILVLSGFFVAEAVTAYAYSLLWLAEGQPQRHGDRTLNALACVCLIAMLAEFVALLYFVARIFRRSS